MSHQHPCESCSMPIETGRYCSYCVDERGELQPFEDRFERMVAWHARKTPEVSINDIFSVGDMTIAESRMSGTYKGSLGPMKATNKPVSLHTLDIFTIRDGKISAGRTYSNSVEMLTQTGMLPKPKAAIGDAKTGPEKTDKAPSAKTEKSADKPKDAPKTDKR